MNFFLENGKDPRNSVKLTGNMKLVRIQSASTQSKIWCRFHQRTHFSSERIRTRDSSGASETCPILRITISSRLTTKSNKSCLKLWTRSTTSVLIYPTWSDVDYRSTRLPSPGATLTIQWSLDMTSLIRWSKRMLICSDLPPKLLKAVQHLRETPKWSIQPVQHSHQGVVRARLVSVILGLEAVVAHKAKLQTVNSNEE